MYHGGVWGQFLRKTTFQTSPYPTSHARHFFEKAKLFQFVKSYILV